MPYDANTRTSASDPQLIQTDHQSLAHELRDRVLGEVRFDDGSRALYATDGSNYRQPPIGVVIPRTRDDVIHTVRTCHKYGVPILARGCGTSLAGQTCNTAVVIDMSKYLNRILELNPDEQYARVQPGLILDNLRDAAEKHHLTFAPDPATHTHNTLGGMIGNNSCGVHSVMGGRTSDNIIEMEIITYDGDVMTVGATTEAELQRIAGENTRRGDIYRQLRALRDQYGDEIRSRFPDIPRRVSGYNLPDLLPENDFHVARALVGSESTCAMVLEAKVRLVDSPPVRSLLVLGYPDVYAAGDHVPRIMAFHPTGCEGLDDRLVQDMKTAEIRPENAELLPQGKGWLIVELGGQTPEDAERRAREVMQALEQEHQPPTMKFYIDPEDCERIWKIRESGLAATAHVPGEPMTWPGWEDSAVPPEHIGDYLRELRALLEQYGYGCDLYGHFGQGCVHTRIDFDLESAGGIENYKAFLQDAARLVVRFGGALSGEHGDGQARGELLPIMYGERIMQAFRDFKNIWDPQNKMNPGKVINAAGLDQNLRLGRDYTPPELDTWFSYQEDGGDFSRAVLRCVGIGKCRRESGGTMCPSFMATHEEKHTTRGRARMLFEMLRGDVIQGGWKEDAVKEALDLCLSCKGCKHDCPVNVDMATYKAEFNAHYYQGRPRPLAAYGFGLIDRWAAIAGKAPRLANFLSQSPVLSSAAKRMAGLAPQRPLPRFSEQTFKRWFGNRSLVNPGHPRVILWADTFNNHFHPRAAIAAVEVLEQAGCQVSVPQQHLCCGRPLYEWGMLERARSYLLEILDTLRHEINQGTLFIGLEPACVSVFREDLPNLLPHNKTAQRLRNQFYLFSEFLAEKTPELNLPRLERPAVVHGHCHHKSVLGMDAELKVLERLGLDFRVLDSGCCGMAGSFGFEKEKYEVSVQCAERALLPALREISDQTLVIANGFSCRQQIEDLSSHRAMHLAEVVQMALRRKLSTQRAEIPQPVTASED